MALPNGAGGYQIGAGNASEAQLLVQAAPTALTAAATATAAQLANGLFTFNGTAGNLTLPTVADLEEGIPNAVKVNAAFDFFVKARQFFLNGLKGILKPRVLCSKFYRYIGHFIRVL